MFALLALRPALAVPGRRTALGAWFVAASLVAAECAAEAVLRLDCRGSDAGCTVAVATASWHGMGHLIVGIPGALATVAAPFALAHRMRLVEGWRDLVRPAVVVGVLMLVGVLSYGIFGDSAFKGVLNRLPLLLASIGVVALAWRVKSLAQLPPR
jgi:hypothetical protein